MTIRRGELDDFEAVFALGAEKQRDHLRWRWELPSFDPERHLWLAEHDGDAVAFGALYAPDAAVVGGDASQLRALLAAIEEQARADGVPQLTNVLPESDARERAYLDAGFEVATAVLQMEASVAAAPPDAPPPDRVRLRTYGAGDARRVQALLDDAYTWDDTYVPLSHEDWVAWMTGHDSFDPTCWWLAEADDALVGVCLTWREGWVKDLATAPAWRGRGLGKSLLVHALREHRARGNDTLGLKVDARNPTNAVALYERCGLRVVQRFDALVKHL